MLNSIYHIALNLLKNHILDEKTLDFTIFNTMF